MSHLPISSDLRQIRFQILPFPSADIGWDTAGENGLIARENGVWWHDSEGDFGRCRLSTLQKAAENRVSFQMGSDFLAKDVRVMDAHEYASCSPRAIDGNVAAAVRSGEHLEMHNRISPLRSRFRDLIVDVSRPLHRGHLPGFLAVLRQTPAARLLGASDMVDMMV